MSRFRNNILPAIAWAGFCIAVPHWHMDPLWFFFGLRWALVFVLLLIRHAPLRTAPAHQVGISWFSAFLPMLLSWNFGTSGGAVVAGMGIVLLGTLLSGLALVDLGRSFGISPAARPFVGGGIYKFVRHPMYVGHALTELGILAFAPTMRNLFIVLLSSGLYAVRIKWEERLGEDTFAQQNTLAAHAANI